MASVSLQNVTKIFDEKVVAVSDFSLEVADGRFVVIVGPSGCGKTTTLRLIAGLEKPTLGSIYIADKFVNDVPPRDRDVAMVFQDYTLYPHMTVYQNMAFGLEMRNLPKSRIKQRVKETARILGIEHLLDRRPKALSGGQCQRAAIGKAVVRRPKVFLFDEPLSNLDAKLRHTCRAELKKLHTSLKATTIYVTHDQAEAMILGDAVAVCLDGKIQQVGPPLQLYDSPVNRFVAGFLGTPSMNFFNGELKFEQDRTTFVIAPPPRGVKNAVDSIILPRRLKQKLTGYRDRNIILGIRPQDLSPGGDEAARNVLLGTVGFVETLGSVAHVHFTCSTGAEFTACFDSHLAPSPGQTIRIRFDGERIHLFEQGPTGRNVILSSDTPQ